MDREHLVATLRHNEWRPLNDTCSVFEHRYHGIAVIHSIKDTGEFGLTHFGTDGSYIDMPLVTAKDTLPSEWKRCLQELAPKRGV